MLRMGFIDDVEWVLEQTPVARQTALFSATMPPPITKIAGLGARRQRPCQATPVESADMRRSPVGHAAMHGAA
jgi:superfamily II DNA/RNA helicase